MISLLSSSDFKKLTKHENDADHSTNRACLKLCDAPLPSLLEQIDNPVDLFLADGAYDGEATRNLLAEHFGASLEIVIPPPKNATFSSNMAQDPTVRDYQIAHIKTNGRMSWQKTSGYNQRSRVETQMGRWKAVIGPKLKARAFGNQRTEAKIGVGVLNRMTALGRPSFDRTA